VDGFDVDNARLFVRFFLVRALAAAIFVCPQFVKQFTGLVGRADCMSGIFLSLFNSLEMRRLVVEVLCGLNVGVFDIHDSVSVAYCAGSLLLVVGVMSELGLSPLAIIFSLFVLLIVFYYLVVVDRLS